jgi:putative redox protein
MYARRKEWPLENVAIQATHDREPSEGQHGATERVDVIALDIELGGPLTAEQRERLLEIAARCPVHKTLAAPVKIIDRMVVDSGP